MTDIRPPIEVTEEAADWLDRLASAKGPNGPPVSLREDFVKWLLRSPEHVAEMLRLSVLQTDAIEAAQARLGWNPSLLASNTAQVLDLDEAAPSQPAVSPPTKKAGWRWFAAAAAAGAALAIGLLLSNFRTEPPTIATALGEQRSVLLEDGSTLALNTESEVRIRMSPQTRELDLLRGELLVDVAEDPNRPFRVLSGEVVIEAVGTRFNVYRHPDATVVTVLEGRVLLDRPLPDQAQKPLVSTESGSLASSAMTQLELSGGLQATVAPGATQIKPVSADLDRATAWTERRLRFEYEPVGAVAAQFNRYNPSHLLIADPELAARQITGVLDVHDPDAFLALLEGLETIEVRLTAEGHRAVTQARQQRE